MSTATANLTPTNATDAQFRAWGSAISAQFTARGLVQKGDTGQINWTTVLTPAAANTAQGYEIWGFNDLLQSTAPIYFKIEYGSGTSAANPGIWFTFGTNTDGAGTMTGPISTRQQLVSTAYATNSLACYFSGDTNRIQMALFVSGTGATTSQSHLWSIERTKDGSGNDTDLGLLVVWKTTTSAVGQLFWNRSTGTPSNGSEAGWTCISNTGTTGKNGVQVAVYPLFLNNAGIFVNPPLGILTYLNADIVAFGAITFSIYGANHVYMPLSNTTFSVSNMLYRTTGSPAPMMRYE